MEQNLSRYFVPGPTWVRPEIAKEMTRPMIGHRSGEFRTLYRKVTDDLLTLFGTREHAFIASSSGTGLLEAALVNCVNARLLVTTCGAFSERWLDIAISLGIPADHLQQKWGEPVDPERLRAQLRSAPRPYEAVTLTQNETSTGVMSDIRTLAAVVRETSPETLVLVDSVSALGSMPLWFDDWGLDVCVASTQKGLALPPGLTVFAVSARAIQRAIQKRYRGTYFDFLEYRDHAAKDGPPFTPSIPHIYALEAQLEAILRGEGLENRWERHRRMRDRTLDRTTLYAAGVTPRKSASTSVTTLRPTRLEPAKLLQEMKRRGFTLGSGYSVWKATTFRIGHMGDISEASLDEMLDVLEEVARG